MEKSELRIGNYVLSKMCGLIKVQFIPVDIDMDNYEPIPLTEEILFKCGFKRSITGNFEIKDFVYDLNKLTICNIVSSNFKPCVKYLHQLQNLYFALKNEELEINL